MTDSIFIAYLSQHCHPSTLWTIRFAQRIPEQSTSLSTTCLTVLRIIFFDTSSICICLLKSPYGSSDLRVLLWYSVHLSSWPASYIWATAHLIKQMEIFTLPEQVQWMRFFFVLFVGMCIVSCCCQLRVAVCVHVWPHGTWSFLSQSDTWPRSAPPSRFSTPLLPPLSLLCYREETSGRAWTWFIEKLNEEWGRKEGEEKRDVRGDAEASCKRNKASHTSV